jgi:hypothetical protein
MNACHLHDPDNPDGMNMSSHGLGTGEWVPPSTVSSGGRGLRSPAPCGRTDETWSRCYSEFKKPPRC